jgi:hypothetical protein
MKLIDIVPKHMLHRACNTSPYNIQINELKLSNENEIYSKDGYKVTLFDTNDEFKLFSVSHNDIIFDFGVLLDYKGFIIEPNSITIYSPDLHYYIDTDTFTIDSDFYLLGGL